MKRLEDGPETEGLRTQIAFATAIISVELAIAVFFLREIAMTIAR